MADNVPYGHDLTPEQASVAVEEFEYVVRDATNAVLETSVFAGTREECSLWAYTLLAAHDNADAVYETCTHYIKLWGHNAPTCGIYRRKYNHG